MRTRPKVAICQSHIIAGGRLRVILGIVDILNEAGIVPDILTSHLAIPVEQVNVKYQQSVQANFHRIPFIPRLPHEFAILLFNAVLRRYAARYNLIINTSNSLAFLPKSATLLTYMFYPRKRRVMANEASIHRPESDAGGWSLLRFSRIVLRPVYRLVKPHANHHIVCLSHFTRSALEQAYDVAPNLPVVYPPVDIADFVGGRRARGQAVVTVGRFAPDKRQLEQIRLAERLSDIPFHIVGFAGNNDYYRRCRRYVEEHKLGNVHLHPDIPYEQMVTLLQESRFFLHTLINEPFGITAVQAIAAGCLPIVHDSGGQREVVPETRLRYQDLSAVPDILTHLEGMDAAEQEALVHRLQDHVTSNFDVPVFHRKMKSVLAPYLGLPGAGE